MKPIPPITFRINAFTGWLQPIINEKEAFPRAFEIFLIHNDDQPAGRLILKTKNEWLVVATSRQLRNIKYDLLKVVEKHFDISED